MVAALIMTIRRTYEAADSVIGAVENVTVQFVHEMGEESIKVVPLLIGVFITAILLLLRAVANKLWWSRKEMMKADGESPEGNATKALADEAAPADAARALLGRVPRLEPAAPAGVEFPRLG